MQPTAFRVYDFKSIRDSGECGLSGDGITALAGQNESGKTAVLTALRDFDLEEDKPPVTSDFRPEDRVESAVPRVSVRFTFPKQDVVNWLAEDKLRIPTAVLERLGKDGYLWITRNLDTGKFGIDAEIVKMWDPLDETGKKADASKEDQVISASTIQALLRGESDRETRAMDPPEFAKWLRDYWPSFIYFDSFEDSLPRSIPFAEIRPATQSATSSQGSGTTQTTKKRAPQSVRDFITLADIDIKLLAKYAEEDKNLSNYLSGRSAHITGDFLTYWKQRTGQQTVDLRVRHHRDSDGDPHLAFYVHDVSDQYPEQRSRGFLWFLSFYLRLAAARKRDPERTRLLLIDEPGTYLHARAQRDVLHLLEARLAEVDQVVYSTHSPYLLPPDKLHRIRVAIKTHQDGTLVLDRLTHPKLRGEDAKDTLLPILAAIGIDITQALNFAKPKSLLVEGISDHFYLMSWSQIVESNLHSEFNVFPGFGASTVPNLASMLIGWGLPFLALVDRDGHGNAARDKLVRELAVDERGVIQPKGAVAIEDIFSHEDFRELLKAMDGSFSLETGETPSKAISRQNVDKVLLARKFSERVASGKKDLTKKTLENIKQLLGDLAAAWTAVHG